MSPEELKILDKYKEKLFPGNYDRIVKLKADTGRYITELLYEVLKEQEDEPHAKQYEKPKSNLHPSAQIALEAIYKTLGRFPQEEAKVSVIEPSGPLDALKELDQKLKLGF